MYDSLPVFLPLFFVSLPVCRKLPCANDSGSQDELDRRFSELSQWDRSTARDKSLSQSYYAEVARTSNVCMVLLLFFGMWL